jgi:hypothetical protein
VQKVKVSELTNRQLDWAVAKAEGYHFGDGGNGIIIAYTEKGFPLMAAKHWNPSENWFVAGPIISRMCKEAFAIHAGSLENGGVMFWLKDKENKITADGENLLIAAMRAYVESKLGTEIEIPKELI